MSYLIECPKCEAVIGAEIIGQTTEEETCIPIESRISLCKCPICHSALVGIEDEDPENDKFDSPRRVWPLPPKEFNDRLPKIVYEALVEANKCLHAKAYSASIAMCGRALEAIGRHFYPDKNKLMLKNALDKLAEDKIIDGQLHEWGKVLHDDRNLAAHPSGTDFKKQDAEDELKFASNICEYIFVLSEDFKEFEKRRSERTKAPKK